MPSGIQCAHECHLQSGLSDGCIGGEWVLGESSQSGASVEQRAADVGVGAFRMSPSAKHQGSPVKRTMWSFDDFIIVRKLNEGRFGKIYLAKEKETKCAVVLKSISKEMIRFHGLAHQLQREIQLQEYAGRYNRNILRLFAYFWDEERVVLVLEYANGGSLQDLLDYHRQCQPEPYLPENKVRIILQQLLSALAFLHEREIIHRDLKPDNILFHGQRLLLADFSWAVRLNRTNPRYRRRYTVCGTLDYLSPEQVLRQGCTTKADVWAVGAIAYRLLCGFLPFEMVGARDACSRISIGDVRYPSHLSVSARNLLEGLLCVAETTRFSCNQALSHPFIKGGNNYPRGCLVSSAKTLPTAREAGIEQSNDLQASRNSPCCGHKPERNETGEVHQLCSKCQNVPVFGDKGKEYEKLKCPLVSNGTCTPAVGGTRTPVSGQPTPCASFITVSSLNSTEGMQSVSNVSATSTVSDTQSEWLPTVSPIKRTSVVNARAGQKCSRDDTGTSSHGESHSGMRLHTSASDDSGSATAHRHRGLGGSVLPSSTYAPPTVARGGCMPNRFHCVAGRGMPFSEQEQSEVADCVMHLCFDDDDCESDANNSKAVFSSPVSPYHARFTCITKGHEGIVSQNYNCSL
uniref:Aurora kinase n=1 Tax=Trypanosoma congolense (strain IL3000) TaxID=1068625 RepID=G0UTB8_TRYCI|nr:putative protein kinase [Trypanosoma congolense IL3000]